MGAKYHYVIHAVICGDDPRNPTYIFHPTYSKVKIDKKTMELHHRHSRLRTPFTITKDTVGKVPIEGMLATVHVPEPPKELSPDDQLYWKLGYALLEATKLCH